MKNEKFFTLFYAWCTMWLSIIFNRKLPTKYENLVVQKKCCSFYELKLYIRKRIFKTQEANNLFIDLYAKNFPKMVDNYFCSYYRYMENNLNFVDYSIITRVIDANKEICNSVILACHYASAITNKIFSTNDLNYIRLIFPYKFNSIALDKNSFIFLKQTENLELFDYLIPIILDDYKCKQEFIDDFAFSLCNGSCTLSDKKLGIYFKTSKIPNNVTYQLIEKKMYEFVENNINHVLMNSNCLDLLFANDKISIVKKYFHSENFNNENNYNINILVELCIKYNQKDFLQEIMSSTNTLCNDELKAIIENGWHDLIINYTRKLNNNLLIWIADRCYQDDDCYKILVKQRELQKFSIDIQMILAGNFILKEKSKILA